MIQVVPNSVNKVTNGKLPALMYSRPTISKITHLLRVGGDADGPRRIRNQGRAGDRQDGSTLSESILMMTGENGALLTTILHNDTKGYQ